MPSKSYANSTHGIDPVAQFSGYIDRSREKMTKVHKCTDQKMSLEEELQHRSLSRELREPQFKFDED
jgi:hypothetical protein